MTGAAHPLTVIRSQRGWSLSETARRIANRVPGMAVHREKVWRWENRGVVPDDAAQRALAAEIE